MAHMSISFDAASIFASSYNQQLLLNWKSGWTAGAVGGPLCVGLLTPNRNAMTLSAKDQTSSLAGIYRRVFADGVVRAWRGGFMPTVAAVPQFACIGPVYHEAEKRTGSAVISVFIAAFAESITSFGAARRNAQVQFNATRSAPAERIPQDALVKLGPGFGSHVLRNAFAMMGIRLFAPNVQAGMQHFSCFSELDKEQSAVVADFVSSTAAATLSFPFNQIFSWSVCTPELQKEAATEKLRMYSRYLIGTYRARGMSLLGRDLAARASYTGLLFTLYHFVERRLIE
eukprot:gnl/TRDRNA2_/TRDRNA2_56855_c0_seq1.p1 gnl/TRDRNA2_/TRDRNA2_56855_c0~~gnl/TRDRNA2_/TRDRNA2_56855_c0_seq1.p1  ORF type:complete len:286 (+),score=36.85 gnl/TRDRNA2_/TRDRNA2_56855_c0_seq1:72-929(+)